MNSNLYFALLFLILSLWLPKVVLSKDLRLHKEYSSKQAWRRYKTSAPFVCMSFEMVLMFM
jgi:hypothetical protein